jgi:sugar/nucleoside kinase (ribokinase family)
VLSALPELPVLPVLPVLPIKVVGDVVTDIIVRPHSTIAHGTDTASSITIGGGGSGANTAAWIAFLGGACDFVGRVGADQAGWHHELLSACGVRTFLAVDSNLPTARIVVLVEPSGERTMLTDRGANDALSVADLAKVVGPHSVVHVSGYTLLFDGPRAAGLQALEEGRRNGVITSVDPNSSGFLSVVGPEHFLAMTSGVDLCFPNADELVALSGMSDVEAGACALNAHYATVVGKLGSAGAIVAQNGRVTARVPAEATVVVDTTGAGDSFAAGYLFACAHGRDTHECLQSAVRTAARAVAGVGARPDPTTFV